MESAPPEVLAFLTDTTGVREEDGANAWAVAAAKAAKRKAIFIVTLGFDWIARQWRQRWSGAGSGRAEAVVVGRKF